MLVSNINLALASLSIWAIHPTVVGATTNAVAITTIHPGGRPLVFSSESIGESGCERVDSYNINADAYTQNMCRSYDSLPHIMPDCTDKEDIVPKIIHSVDRDGIYTAEHAAIKGRNPSFKINHHGDASAREYILEKCGQEAADAYGCFLAPSYRADLFRFCAMYAEGGVYLDSDVVPLVQIEEMYSTCSSASIGHDIPQNDVKQSGKQMKILASAPGSPMFKCAIDTIISNIHKRYIANNPLAFTGPTMLNICYTKHSKDVAITYHDTRQAQWPFTGLRRGTHILATERPGSKAFQKNLGDDKNDYAFLWAERKIYTETCPLKEYKAGQDDREKYCIDQFSLNDVPIKIVQAHYGDDNRLTFRMAIYDKEQDGISKEIDTNGVYDIEYTTKIMDTLKDQPLAPFIDVGANIGWYSFVAAMKGRLSYAIEPVESHRKLIEITACLNDDIATNLIIVPHALGAQSSDDGVTTTLDELVEVGDIYVSKYQTSVLNINVDGNEYLAMSGASKYYLKTTRPGIILNKVNPHFFNGHGITEMASKYITMMTEAHYVMSDIYGNPISYSFLTSGINNLDATDIVFTYKEPVADDVIVDSLELEDAVYWRNLQGSMSMSPTAAPAEPTAAPFEPTTAPVEPTAAPTSSPSNSTAPVEPTPEPTFTPEPTTAPVSPTAGPVVPTEIPATVEPTAAPSEPTTAPVEPTAAPFEPTTAPVEPTTAPTSSPSNSTTTFPSESPTSSPSNSPTSSPSISPTINMGIISGISAPKNPPTSNAGELEVAITEETNTILGSSNTFRRRFRTVDTSGCDVETDAVDVGLEGCEGFFAGEQLEGVTACYTYSITVTKKPSAGLCNVDAAMTEVQTGVVEGEFASIGGFLLDVTDSPSDSPSLSLSFEPSIEPSTEPSTVPSSIATAEPSTEPSGSFFPSSAPSDTPTESAFPSAFPTSSPSESPTSSPSNSPTTSSPSSLPSKSPTSSPSKSPTTSPSESPTSSPSNSPTSSPSKSPTTSPSESPTTSPSESPTSSPSNSPTSSPSKSPTTSPSESPTSSPSNSPTSSPSNSPTTSPSESPTNVPSDSPTNMPSSSPTKDITGPGGTVNGGIDNTAFGISATVSGGRNNNADGDFSSISGGLMNKNTGEKGTISGGSENQISEGQRCTIGGGGLNQIVESNDSTIAGGFQNLVTGDDIAVGGGIDNIAEAEKATIAGGANNKVTGVRSTIGGGGKNTCSGEECVISGGQENVADEKGTTISGGFNNTATLKSYSTISGGRSNFVSGNNAVISGGNKNSANGKNSVVGGGQDNIVTGSNSIIAGGRVNRIFGQDSTINGGTENKITVEYGAIGGGLNNQVIETKCTIAGGSNNVCNAEGGNIAGGFANTVGTGRTGLGTVVIGGRNNTATRRGGVVLGGENNLAFGDYAIAAGINADAFNAQSVVFNIENREDTARSEFNGEFKIKAQVFTIAIAGQKLQINSDNIGNLIDVLDGNFRKNSGRRQRKFPSLVKGDDAGGAGDAGGGGREPSRKNENDVTIDEPSTADDTGGGKGGGGGGRGGRGLRFRNAIPTPSSSSSSSSTTASIPLSSPSLSSIDIDSDINNNDSGDMTNEEMIDYLNEEMVKMKQLLFDIMNK